MHAFQATSAEGFKTLEVKFTTEDEEIISMLSEIDDVTADQDSQIFMLFSRIILEGQRQSNYYKTMSAALLLESLVLMRRISRQKAVPIFDMPQFTSPSRTETDGDPFEIVTEYISRNIMHSFSLGDMATDCGYNQDYIYRAIKKRTGMPAIKYVNHLRLERIKSLIQYTELSLTEIAWNMGFDNLQYFSRFFKQNAGVTASEYVSKVRMTFRIDYES